MLVLFCSQSELSAVVLPISGNVKDWRCMPTSGDTLNCPDDSLASLSQLNTLMSFGWSNPAAPETTLILHNDVPLDEQLIASLPQTPGIQYHVKKKMTPAGPKSYVSKSKTKSKKRLDESSHQVCMLHLHQCCVIRLHHSTSQMRPIATCLDIALSVCLSVCLS